MDKDPSALRKVYFTAWQKELKNQPISAMEAIIVDVIKRHPEYHALFSHSENFGALQTEKFALDHNPFFHLALHITIIEQINADRPKGITALYQRLFKKYRDQMSTEHKIMECLAKILIENFNSEHSNNDALYLESVQRLL